MRDALFPLRFLLVLFAGFANRQQQQAIDFLREENRVLKAQLRGRRLRLTDEERRRLAAKGVALGRRLLDSIATIVTPDTILAWHRRLIAARWTFAGKRRQGRPPVMARVRELAVRMARDNPSWSYQRIRGARRHLGHVVARTTVASILKANGIKPAPERPTSWRSFLRAHAGVVAAADFFTVEVWTARGLVTLHLLFAIDLATRAVEILGVTPHPDGAFLRQVARNLTHRVGGFLCSAKWLTLDRDTKFTAQFRRILDDAGVGVVTTAFQAPNMNAIAERFVGSIKRECLSKLILFGEDQLRRAVRDFVEHYHEDRPHQGLGNRRIGNPGEAPLVGDGEVVADERLGGLLRSYRRSA